jgi:anti-sigma-K factor RskA
LALGLGLWGSRLSGELDETRAALEQQRVAASLLAEPGVRTASLRPGAVAGRLVVAPDGRAVLVVAGLDRAPSGKAYELWVVARGTPSPAGLFAGGEETEVVSVQGDVPEGSVVAVTIEDEGGAQAPSTDPIAVSQPV